MAGSKLAVLAALAGNLLIAIAKLVGGLASGSAAMFAEAAHSFSDVGNQVLLLVGIRKAEAPPSERHPFGGGKSAYFWPFLVAVLLFGFAGGYSVFEGIEKLDVVRMYRRMRFPQLSDRGSIDAENVIQLFESSKYIALREACNGPTATQRAQRDRMGYRALLKL